MVYKCFVYGCKAYKSPKNATFGIPKDPELRRQWEKALRPYSHGKILQSKHRVCKAHFRAEELELFYKHLISGTEVKIERGRPELLKGAVPSIFPGQKKPPRRILSYKNKVEEAENQSILLLNGEWVHVKNPPKAVTPTRKCKRVQPPDDNSQSENVNVEEVTNQTVSPSLKIGEISNSSDNSGPSESGPSHVVFQVHLPETEARKPANEISINWETLPLPKEISSLLCDSILAFQSSSEFQQPITQSPLSPPSPTSPTPLSPTRLSPTPPPPEDLPEHPPEENFSVNEDVPEDSNLEERSNTLSFQSLLSGISSVKLPSPMWGFHSDQTRVYFSWMSFSGSMIVPVVEKIVMYQVDMAPRLFLRGIEIPVSESKASSIEDINDVLSYIDKLKLCAGIDKIGDVVTYSSNCDIFVQSNGRSRCGMCRKEKMLELSENGQSEYGNPKSSLTQSPKKEKT